MDTATVSFMRDLEGRYQKATGLPNRSRYKIFYGQVHPALILTLSINPGGDPSKTSADGRTHQDGRIASASAGFFENGEHDVLDCEWPENRTLGPLLVSILGGDLSRLRSEVVKTNMAFRRSAKKGDIDMDAAIAESTPFLIEILRMARPRLVLLTGVNIFSFATRFARKTTVLAPEERDPKVKQVVYAAAEIQLRDPDIQVPVVQVAHASQFGWTYQRYGVAARVRAILDAQPSNAPAQQQRASPPVVGL